MKKQKGFTLIELLVVIAIIALLLAIIIPSLRTAKLYAQAAVCLSNANGLLKGWTLYAQDNNDRLVGPVNSSIVSPDYSWVMYPQDINGQSVPDAATVKEDEIRGIQKGLLFKYIENPDSYHCPADKRYLEPCPGGTGTLGWRTYSISSGIGPCSLFETQQYLKYYPHTKITTIPNPGNKYVFLEEGERHRGYNLNAWVFKPLLYDKLTDSLGFFHGDKSIMGFADGHAEKHIWWDKDIIDRSRDGAAGDFTVSNPESEDMVFLRQNFTYERLYQ